MHNILPDISGFYHYSSNIIQAGFCNFRTSSLQALYIIQCMICNVNENYSHEIMHVIVCDQSAQFSVYVQCRTYVYVESGTMLLVSADDVVISVKQKLTKYTHWHEVYSWVSCLIWFNFSAGISSLKPTSNTNTCLGLALISVWSRSDHREHVATMCD